jgi:hypothetical protein
MPLERSDGNVLGLWTMNSSEPVAYDGAAAEPLVIPLRAARRTRIFFAAASIAFTVGPAIWIVVSRSWSAIIYGGFAIVAFTWVWLSRLSARRARHGAPLAIVATSEGISSPLWSLDWSRVSRIWIGDTSGGLPALNIEPMRREDVELKTRSRALRLNARLGEAMNMPALQILQANVDRPLEELARDFERLARRALRS